ncbi:MAG TPA: DNA internalization-related competence protein ComEC/Rec2 [Lachnospiraceae bacterium]|nr:DNA internalization-related competence protein ComEC/Rec2 [Lachnospiraceae bacterium]
MKRPLLHGALLFIAGIIFGRYIPFRGYTALFLVCIIYYLIVQKQRFKTNFVLALPIFILMGGLSLLKANINLPYYDGIAGVRGVVESTNITKTNRQIVILKTDEIYFDGKLDNEKYKIQVLLNHGVLVNQGDLIAVRGNISVPQTPNNPGGFNQRAYANAMGINYQMVGEKVTKYGESHRAIYDSIADFRQKINAVYDSIFPPSEAGLVKAMVTGDTSGLEDDIRGLYSNTGISHILAVSGLHTGILAFLLLWILRKCVGINKRIASAVVMVILLGYAVFAGEKPAVVRAVIMMEIILFGNIIYRDKDIFNSLGLAAIIILAINPYQLWDVSFQLSFVTVGGLILAGKFIMGGYTFKQKLIYSFKIGAVVNIVSFPIVAWHFYRLPLYGCFANLIVLPLIGILVGCAMISGLIGLVWIQGATFLGGTVFVILKIYEGVCIFFTSLPFSTVLTGRPPLVCIVFYYTLILIIFFWRFKGKKIAFGINLMVLLFLIIGNRLITKNTEVAFIDIGQGDCAVIHTYDNKTYVIDGGGETQTVFGNNTGKTDIIPYLESKGIATVDGVFITHMDTDHAMGCAELIAFYQVENVYMSKYDWADDGLYEFIKLLANRSGTKINYIGAGEDAKINEQTTMECVYPYDQKIIDDDNDNHGSLVLKLCVGEKSILFTGDAEAQDEMLIMLGGADISADVLKVAHHGSRNSSTGKFLEAVGAKTAVISCGKNNNYGHPNPEAVKRIEDTNATIYTTPNDGCITITTDGKNMNLKTMKQR